MKTTLTTLQYAIIMVIHKTNAEYEFKHNELSAAKRLVKRKLLKRISINKFTTTKLGDRLYCESHYN
jgi:hypothetical protein